MPDEPVSFHMIVAEVDGTGASELGKAGPIGAETDKMYAIAEACI